MPWECGYCDAIKQDAEDQAKINKEVLKVLDEVTEQVHYLQIYKLTGLPTNNEREIAVLKRDVLTDLATIRKQYETLDEDK